MSGASGMRSRSRFRPFTRSARSGRDVELRIYTNVREDAIQLFGFKTNRERDLYLKLISVQGVGAKSGITMLCGMSADEIVSAIRTENLAKADLDPRRRAKNGRTTCDRASRQGRRDRRRRRIRGASTGAAAGVGVDDVYDDALSALVNLGYQRNAAEKALQQVRQDGVEANVQKILRASTAE